MQPYMLATRHYSQPPDPIGSIVR